MERNKLNLDHALTEDEMEKRKCLLFLWRNLPLKFLIVKQMEAVAAVIFI